MKTLIALFAFCFIITGLNAQNVVQIDSRALNHYDRSKVEEMPLSKIEKINYLFQQSFIVEESSKAFIDVNKFDVFPYAIYRKENERVRINIAYMGEKRIEGQVDAFIILLSHKELDAAYNSILNKYE